MEQNRLICIVDDAPDYRLILQKMFARFLPTCSVRFFAGGDEFIRQLPHIDEQPGLIIMDRHMPGMDGHQTLLYLKQHPSYQKIPVVMMSADVSQEEIDKCYEAGVNSFLVKVFQADLLRETLILICRYWLDLNQKPSNA